MRVTRDEVPLEIRRRAARHLEAVRGTPGAVGSDAAQLGDEACPVYRPDVRGVAYWELEIAGVKAVPRDGGDGPREATGGFIILSAGRHDVPIPHWSTELEPPSRTLEGHGKGVVARVVKLDALAYAAEDAKGTYLTHIGQFPPMPSGLPPVPPAERVLGSLESHPVTPSKADRRTEKQEAKETGARAPRPKVAPWPSWAQAKKQYAAAYKPLLAALKAHAAPAWEIEDLVAKLGEGIHEGDRVVVPLLAPGKAELTGDGAKAVKMRMLKTTPPAVELVAGGAERKAEQEFQLRFAYRDGTVETLPFFVVPKGTPSNSRRVLPHPVPVLSPR
jgi:hypothetical protein